MRFITVLLIAALVPTSAGVAADVPPPQRQADVEIALSARPAFPRPGSTGTLEVTLINHGPDTDFPAAATDIQGRGVRFFAALEEQCSSALDIFHLEPPSQSIYTYLLAGNQGHLPAGESLTCTIPFEIARDLPTPIEVEYRTNVSRGTVDPDLTNNRASLTFGSRPAAVPTLSLPAAIALLCGLLIGACRQHGRGGSDR